MRNWLIAVSLGLTLMMNPAAAQTVFRVGTEGAYTPWNMTSPTGELVGFEIDLANALCERMAAQCKFISNDWEGIFPALKAGNFDAVMSGVAITEEHRKQTDFTKPYAITPLLFIARKDSPLQALETLDQVHAALRGKRVGVQVGTTSRDFLEQRFGQEIEIVTYPNHDQLQLDLTSGRIDAAFSRMITWKEFMKTANGKDFDVFGPGLTGKDFAGFGEGIGIALPLGSSWRERLNQALAEVQGDGTLRAIHLKWFETDGYLP